MKIDIGDFRVAEGTSVKLGKWATRIKPHYGSKQHYKELLEGQVEQLSEQQQLLYSSNTNAVLFIFQAMDAAGKDGVIKHVMSGVNPQGCQVFSFKHPSATELQHDFLWRTTRDLPERGRIGIFNRSYYEEVLIARVHPEILHTEGLPAAPAEEKTIWHQRYRSIVDFERHHDAQRHPHRQVLPASVAARSSAGASSRASMSPRRTGNSAWPTSRSAATGTHYMKAYEKCLSATSTEFAPWYVVPADDKANARLIVARIVLDTLRSLKMSYPATSAERRRELKAIRRRLTR